MLESDMAKSSFIGNGVPEVLPKPVGRRLSLTPSKLRKIVEAIEAGNYYNVAATLAGVAPHTLSKWMTAGEIHAAECEFDDILQCENECEESNAALRSLFTLVKIAESKAEAKAVSFISNDPNWLARITFLERRFRERWSRPSDKIHQTTDVRISGTLNIGIDQKKIAAEGLAKEIALEERDGVFQEIEKTPAN